jgi:hypothetical protein
VTHLETGTTFARVLDKHQVIAEVRQHQRNIARVPRIEYALHELFCVLLGFDHPATSAPKLVSEF